ncbi:DNA-directed DNA polymerase [Abeliophyllum distichum]|uniref:DNA-directed DNA polymerase n=1 Tax=Abeliophyllum distichum TaxID=126358 RepID=A0ABD1VBR2_9LAMI
MNQMAVGMTSRLQGALLSNTEVNSIEQVHVITTRTGVYLPEIHIKRPVAYKENVPSTDEGHVEQTEQVTYIEESSVTPQVKTAAPIKPYEPPIPYPQRRLGIGKAKPAKFNLQLADRYVKKPFGIVEDVVMRVGKLLFPIDFVVLDMPDDAETPIILGRPFLATSDAIIDVSRGVLTLRV